MKKKTPNHESGSALLLTLGILSLALIVTMAFAFSARTNRQIAKINADQIKARLLAKSALNRVIAAMKMYSDVYLPESSELFSSVPENPELPKFFVSSGSDSTYDLSNDSLILPVLVQFSISSLPSVYYQTITVGGETIGRVAFLVLEEANKLDINQMLSLSGKIPFVKAGESRLASFTETETDGFAYDISAGETPVSEENTFRLGLQMQELRAASDYLTKLPSGYSGTKAKWFSYTHLWRKLWSANSEDALRYTFFSGEDIEAYWDGSTERQCFDITGYEWGGWEVPDKNNLVKKLVKPMDDDPETEDIDESKFQRPEFYGDDSRMSLKATPGIDEQGFGIPYLNSLGDIGLQVAANMVDFCDADNFATTDATWDGTPPTYCGNEKVPYINEIALKFSLIEEKREYKLKLKPTLEVVNIFDEEVPGGEVRICISGKVEFGSEGVKDWRYEISNYTMKKQDKFCYATIDDLGELEVAKSETLSDAVVSGELLVIIGSSNQIYDVAYLKTSTEKKVTLKVGEKADISLEVSDPRCNHRPDYWKISGPSLGERNRIFPTEKPENADMEDYENFLEKLEVETEDEEQADPQFSTFSTAFIPNRPFRNFWELGAIHRGEAFRTLDIAGVDAEILDQVKIGPLKRTHGKFNANSRNPLAWQELLRGINPQDWYEDVNFNTSELDLTVEGDLSHSRAAIAASLAGGSNDREREALIGRTANLLTTRMDKYTVLVIGQALKELEGVTEGNWDDIKKSVVNPVKYENENEYYSILATQRILAHIVRDAWRNEYKIVQLQLLED